MAFAMAGWCRSLKPKGTDNGVPGNHFELADQTGVTTVQVLAAKAKYFRAVIYVKNILAGAASTSFLLQAAPLVTLGAGVQHIDCRSLSGSSGSYSFVLEGFAPDAVQGPLGFVRVQTVPTVGGSWTYDCIIDAL